MEVMGVIECYYKLIKSGKIKFDDIPKRYRDKVEIYYNEMEKKNANS